MEGFRASLAVIIGINQYQDSIPILENAVNDATELARVLDDRERYDNYDEVILKTDQQASLSELRQLLHEELPKRLGENDRLLFYFAGHGIKQDGEDGPVGYILPQDADVKDADSLLSMATLHRWLTDLKCKHMLIILDCCFAGAFRWAGTRDIRELPEVVYKERYAGYIHYRAWQVLTSATHSERALDLEVGGTVFSLGQRMDANGHSPFARSLLDGLGGAGDIVPSGAGDGLITASELFTYLRQRFEPTEAPVTPHQTPGFWHLDRDSWGEYIFFVPQYRSPKSLRLKDAPPLRLDRNPYRGLLPYTEAHMAQLFGGEEALFGREDLIKELTSQVTSHPHTILLGPSGSGKTSVIQAGLLPRLRQTHGESWEILPPIRPGEAPLQALASLTRPDGQNLWQLLSETVLEGSGALAAVVGAWRNANPGKTLCLVIDQLEDLYRSTCSQEEREQFLALIDSAIHAHPGNLRTVVGLRSDAASCLAPTSWLSPDASTPDGPTIVCDVLPLHTYGDLRRSIEGPATAAVIYFESEKSVESLVYAVLENPGAMPLLSQTMAKMYDGLYQLWQERGGGDRALTSEINEKIGGVSRVVKDLAHKVYSDFDADHRNTMRKTMLRMVDLVDGKWVPVRIARLELAAVDEEENVRVATVLDQLTAARLVVQSGDVEWGSFVEPAHVALVNDWDKMSEWIDAEERRAWPHTLSFGLDLAQAVRGWQAAGKESNQLWTDRKRAQALAETLRHEPGRLNRAEFEFAQQSVARARLLSRRNLAVSAIMVALVALAFFVWQARKDGIARADSRTLAEAAHSQIDTDPVTALKLGLEALPGPQNKRPYLDAPELYLRRALQSSLERITLSVTTELASIDQVAFGPDYIAVGGRGLHLVDKALTSVTPLLPLEDEVLAPDWNDSGLLLHRTGDRVLVWEDAKKIADYDFDAPVGQAVWQPGGNQIAVCSGGSLWLWSPLDGDTVTRLYQFPNGSERCVAWSPNGDRLVAWGDDGAVLFAEPGTESPVIPAATTHGDLVLNAVWSDDGRLVVTTSIDGTALLWEMGSGDQPVSLVHDSDVLDAMFVPVEPNSSTDSPKVVTWDAGGHARVWDTKGSLKFTLGEGSSGGGIRGVLYDPVDNRLLTYTDRGQVQAWNGDTGDLVTYLEGHVPGKLIHDAAWQGNYVATASADGTARIWDVETGKQLALLGAHDGPVLGVRWYDAGQALTYGADGSLRLWQILDENKQPLCHGTGRDGLPLCFNRAWILAGKPNDVGSAHWLDDNTLLLTGHGGRAWRWTASSGETDLVADPQIELGEAVWEPTGQRVFVFQKESRGREPTDGHVLVPGSAVTVPVEGPISAAFWLDDCLLVSSENGGVRQVDPDSGRILATFPDHETKVTAAAVFDDLLAVSDLNGLVLVWPLEGGAPHAMPNLDGGNMLTVSDLQWDPAGSRLLVAGKGGIGLWDVSTDTVLWTWPDVQSDLVYGARFSPDGRFIAVYLDKEVAVLTADDAAEIWRTPLAAYSDRIRGVQWVLGSRWPNQSIYASVTDYLTHWRSRFTWRIGGERLLLLAWSCDRTANLWDPESEDVVKAVWHGEYANSILTAAVSPESSHIFAVDLGGYQYLQPLWLKELDQLLVAAENAIQTRRVAADPEAAPGEMEVSSRPDG